MTRCRRSAVALLLAALLASGCRSLGVDLLPSPKVEPPPAPTAFTLVTWNAQKGQNEDFRGDLRRLADSSAPYLILLQEARADLVERPTLAGSFARGWRYPWPGGATIGVLTLSWAPPRRLTPTHSRWREFMVTAPKVALASEHPLAEGETLLAVNLHLLNFQRFSTFMPGAQLEDLEALMRAHAGPIVMAGDFNAWNQRRLDRVEQTVRAIGLDEVQAFPASRRTADMGSPALNWLLGVDPDLPLDRVYYRGLVAREAEVLPYESSDHAALRVQFALPNEEQSDLTRKSAKGLGDAFYGLILPESQL